MDTLRLHSSRRHRVRGLASLLIAWLWILVALAPFYTSTATASAATFTYDATASTRVHLHATDLVTVESAEPAGLWEESASPPTSAQGTSTTPTDVDVATNTATVRHYTTTEAAESITKAGKTIPGSSSGKTWLTPDEYLDGATAQSRLALNKTPDGYFEIPMCRVSCPTSPSRVQPYNGQPGGGIEITTNSTIDVTGLPFIPFGPR